jgi:hypothetical protein
MDDLWMFDATPLPWIRPTFGGAVPGSRVNAAAVVNMFDRVRDGTISNAYETKPSVYLVGGASGGSALAYVRSLSIPFVTTFFLHVFVLTSTSLIMGCFVCCHVFRRLDLTSMDWELLETNQSSDLNPGPLVSHSMVVYHNKLFVFAGGNGKVANNLLHVFDCGACRPVHDDAVMCDY